MEARRFPAGILPVLPVADIDATADYYLQTLHFQENFRQRSPEGTSTDAQLAFEGSTLMINLNPGQASQEGGGIYLWIRLYEKDIDAYYKSLVKAGVQIVDPIQDQFWGDRSFVIRDCNNYYLAFNQVIGG